MESQIEINRLSLNINPGIVNNQDETTFLLEGHLPIIQVPYKIGLINIDLFERSGTGLPEKWTLFLEGEAAAPEWKMRLKPEIIAEVKWRNDIVQWGQAFPFQVLNMSLGETSRFYIDDREIHLTSTFEKLLHYVNSSWQGLNYDTINSRLQTLSKEYFNSSLITDLIKNLYYSLGRDINEEEGVFQLSAAYDQDHFTQIREFPPYLFLTMPTHDLEYFINRLTLPKIVIKGYDIIIQSMEVVGSNGLLISLKEVNKKWDINVDVSLILNKDIIYLEVNHIGAHGLGLLTKTLFRIFKGLLIRQIEKKSVSVQEIYYAMKRDFKSKYPFLEFMPGYSPRIDSLKIGEERTEIMIHFNEEDHST